MTRRNAGSAFLSAGAPVLWTWMSTLVMSVVAQRSVGLDWPSLGLVASSATIPALLVALAPHRWRRGAMVAATAATAMLCTANVAYRKVFGTYIPLRAFANVREAQGEGGYALGVLGPLDLVPVVLFVATVGVAVALSRAPRPSPPRGQRMAWTAICVLGLMPAFRWAAVVAPGDMEPYTGGFIYDHILDARRILGERQMGRTPATEDLSRVSSLLNERRVGRPRSDDAADPWWGVAAGSNLLLIQVESLNAWIRDVQIGNEPAMPALQSLAERGVRFDWIFDQTHLGRSSDADLLVMASQHPLPRDATSMVRPGLDMEAVPDVLAAVGYATLSGSGSVADFWNYDERFVRFGISKRLFTQDFEQNLPANHLPFQRGWLDDELVLGQAAGAISALPDPWMAYLLTATTHGPSTRLPTTVPILPLGPLDGTPTGNYILKARYADTQIGNLLDSLAASGDLAHTTVVVYGDHTEWLGLDKDWAAERLGVQTLAPEARGLLLDRVPLVIAPPPGALPPGLAGTRVSRPGGLIDVGPTILHLMGMDPPRWFLGRSLLADGPSLAVQATGEAVNDSLMWTGSRCYAFPSGEPRPPGPCEPLRARAREELGVSWLITLYGLSAAPTVGDGGR